MVSLSKPNYKEKTLTKFNNICRQTNEPSVMVERIDQPIKDWIQEAWLSCLEQMNKTGVTLNPDMTAEELLDTFAPYAPLIVSCYYNAVSQDHRDRRGNKNSPNKQRMLSGSISLDAFSSDGQPWADLIEDARAELPYRMIEDSDLVSNDPRVKAFTDEQKRAANRFVVAFFLSEAGYALPQVMRNRVSLDRKKTGLPLAF
jgi:hypothetical protein